ncbi:hypothetical protein [Bacillus sp. V5-8f]|uniref:hypothetical protein n=1 Tax=Bacillus sp. V5-8f TaxID=2053044 RepID=UPI000C79479A|nr:hypothetical protein [Bacillus sp. V5-8f]PLT34022.1 hypothetical protein CUU64_10465 [Bacillus sp. V5-8f]
MLYRKAIISFSIFLTLFLGAWFLQQQMKRDHIKFSIYEPFPNSLNDDPFLYEVQAETLPKEWRFGAREYIKVYTPSLNLD